MPCKQHFLQFVKWHRFRPKFHLEIEFKMAIRLLKYNNRSFGHVLRIAEMLQHIHAHEFHIILQQLMIYFHKPVLLLRIGKIEVVVPVELFGKIGVQIPQVMAKFRFYSFIPLDNQGFIWGFLFHFGGKRSIKQVTVIYKLRGKHQEGIVQFAQQHPFHRRYLQHIFFHQRVQFHRLLHLFQREGYFFHKGSPVCLNGIYFLFFQPLKRFEACQRKMPVLVFF